MVAIKFYEEPKAYSKNAREVGAWHSSVPEGHGYSANFTITSLEQLEKEIGKIRERNLRVETDKAWETSTARRIIASFIQRAVEQIRL
ncbi:hypothetical protein AUJ13_03050 [Candidatus Micrarchaeota archaeon CG1_02_49_24]|nr:MAG: hypothetical protein AUJ13_03050 [Candidatus Micrarchaeota archaeon CG1_02_49_24]